MYPVPQNENNVKSIVDLCSCNVNADIRTWCYCAEGASFSATPGFKWLVYVCVLVTDSSDFYEAHMRRLHLLFPLLSFQLGFSGIPENDEKTSISPSAERYTLTLFWDPFLLFFSEKLPFFPRRPGEGPVSRFSSYQGRLRRNPARRVYLFLGSIH